MRAANLPPGFAESVYAEIAPPENFSQIAFAPGGELFIADKFGNVYVHDPAANGGSTEVVPIKRILLNAEGERGINGLAVDPDFTANRRIWVFYASRTPVRNRLSHFIYFGGQLTNETVVIEGPLVINNNHNAGCLRFASDRTLFVAIGDDGQGSITAQDPFDLRGKILHINRDGSGAADNPFLDGVAGDPRVWAYGLRNPFRISLEPETDAVFIGDVGHFRWEELSFGAPGANLGWAAIEGPDPPDVPGALYPVHWYNHFGEGAAIIAGAFARPGDFAPQFEGDHFFADFVKMEMVRLEFDDMRNVVDSELFATDIGPITDMTFGPDGALYYVCRNCAPASVRRIEYVGGTNQQPVAIATAEPASGEAPLDVLLDGSASYDNDDDVLAYDWDLGDATAASIVTMAKTYPAGVYDVRLTVDDGNGGEDTTPARRVVSGNRAPTATLLTPVDGATFVAGQEFLYSGSAVDPEDGAIPCERFRWQVVFHHNDHTHPFLGPVAGACDGSFVVPNRGETDPNVWYSVHLWAGDSGAPLDVEARLEDTQVVEIYPQHARMTFRSEPLDNLILRLDTVPFAAPATVEGVVGIVRRIGAPAQLRNGRTYALRSWSDGGAPSHEIATPGIDAEFVATFSCNVIERVAGLSVDKAGPGGRVRLSWAASEDVCIASGESGHTRYRVYAAATPRPGEGEGRFPADPYFEWVTSTNNTSYTYDALPEHAVYLIVAVGTDGNRGLIGHYGK